MAMSGDMKISPEVFSLSTIRKPSDSWLCPAMSPNPAAGLCSSSFTSIFRMTARSGGCSFTRLSNSSRTEGTPSALISTKLPRLATVPRIPSAWAWRSTAGRKPTPWTIPYTLICLLSVFSIPVPVHSSFLLHVGSPIPACFVQPFLFQTDLQPLVRSLRSDGGDDGITSDGCLALPGDGKLRQVNECPFILRDQSLHHTVCNHPARLKHLNQLCEIIFLPQADISRLHQFLVHLKPACYYNPLPRLLLPERLTKGASQNLVLDNQRTGLTLSLWLFTVCSFQHMHRTWKPYLKRRPKPLIQKMNGCNTVR